MILNYILDTAGVSRGGARPGGVCALAVMVGAGLWLAACRGDVALGRRCPMHEPGCVVQPGDGSPPGYDGYSPMPEGDGGASDTRDDAPRDQALAVHLEDGQGVMTGGSTILCVGACVDVTAVASGGTPPYAFVWEDGPSEPARTLCPVAETTYRVSVTGAGAAGTGAPEAAAAELTVQVSSCAPGDLCIQNASFEGTPAFNVWTFDAPAWVPCGLGTPDIWNETQSWFGGPPGPMASDGATYLAMYSVPLTSYTEAVSEQLCAPLVAGRPYSLKLDLMFQADTGLLAAIPNGIELWAGDASCAQGQLLWRSPVPGPAWEAHCVTFMPEQPYNYLTLSPSVSDVTSAAYVDHIVPVPGCD